MLRPATIVAASFEVLCPYCGETLPDPDHGSHFWETKQLREIDSQQFTCDSCDRTFVVFVGPRAQILRRLI